MRLTKKKAWQLTVELWDWLAETGKQKEEWPMWAALGEYAADCPLCEYTYRGGRHGCDFCILGDPIEQKGVCLGAGFSDWQGAADYGNVEEMKRAAKIFADRIRENGPYRDYWARKRDSNG